MDTEKGLPFVGRSSLLAARYTPYNSTNYLQMEDAIEMGVWPE